MNQKWQLIVPLASSIAESSTPIINQDIYLKIETQTNSHCVKPLLLNSVASLGGGKAPWVSPFWSDTVWLLYLVPIIYLDRKRTHFSVKTFFWSSPTFRQNFH